MVTDAQVRLLRQKLMDGKTQETAAAAAGMSVRAARKWSRGPMPSEVKRPPRGWRTREDPFAEVWTTVVLPDDFDDRFFRVAPSALQIRPALVGGEPFELLNLGASPRITGIVPRLPTRVRVRNAWIRPHVDLVVIEPDEDRISVTLRATVDVTGELDELPRVLVIDKTVKGRSGRGVAPDAALPTLRARRNCRRSNRRADILVDGLRHQPESRSAGRRAAWRAT